METNISATVVQRLVNGYSIVEHLLVNSYASVSKWLGNYQNILFTSENQQLVKGWSTVGELSKKSLPMHIYIHRHRDIHIHRDMDRHNSRRGNTSVAFKKNRRFLK